MPVDAYIAIGSNIGDRVINIQTALAQLKVSPGVASVESTGFLYDSAPMYYEDQRTFLNTCCKITTSLSAHDLLSKVLKPIETNMGRVKEFVNGPRCIDLDLILYGPYQVISDSPDLIIPHPRMQERPFVLAPLADIAPELVHPVTGKSILDMRDAIQDDSCYRVFPGVSDKRLFRLGDRSYILGILNVTPDSFSDGGKYDQVETAVAHAREMITQGADVIDVGGESTRPRAGIVEADEEQSRVVDVIARLRAEFPAIPISIDTYKASTARLAVLAGASIVNDVSAGLIDSDMLTTVADLGVPYMFAHAGRVGSHPPCDFGDGKSAVFEPNCADVDGAVNIITSQIHKRVNEVLASGIHPWNIVLDPGFGFAKSGNLNFQLARRFGDVFHDMPFPTMSGVSRKRFLRDLKNDGADWVGPESQAVIGTVAVTVAMMGASSRLPDFHRVHDVGELKHALVLADNILREKRVTNTPKQGERRVAYRTYA
jgi:dihydroneopterin aldolase / 2-amino-4-hydroxy-6-hydroxymethyldihydropteridine diphosphokinase / dihydropteroate synthase